MPRISPVSYKKLICVFEKAGFAYRRTKGDHLIYVKEACLRPLVIPMYDDVPVFVIKNLLRTAGIDRDDYLLLLLGC